MMKITNFKDVASSAFLPEQVIFIHGKESGPESTKIRAMAGPCAILNLDVFAPDLRDEPDPEVRAQLVYSMLDTTKPAVLVGSSMGGWVAARVAELAATHKPGSVVGLYLLCPAFGLPGYPSPRPAPALPASKLFIVHGRHDEIVPLQQSEQAAQDWNCSILTLEDGHRLTDSLSILCLNLLGFLRTVQEAETC